jgi:hypothetical protein
VRPSSSGNGPAVRRLRSSRWAWLPWLLRRGGWAGVSGLELGSSTVVSDHDDRPTDLLELRLDHPGGSSELKWRVMAEEAQRLQPMVTEIQAAEGQSTDRAARSRSDSFAPISSIKQTKLGHAGSRALGRSPTP